MTTKTVYSPERDALLTDMWAKGEPRAAIRAALNRLPGLEILSDSALNARVRKMPKATRPKRPEWFQSDLRINPESARQRAKAAAAARKARADARKAEDEAKKKAAEEHRAAQRKAAAEEAVRLAKIAAERAAEVAESNLPPPPYDPDRLSSVEGRQRQARELLSRKGKNAPEPAQIAKLVNLPPREIYRIQGEMRMGR